MESLYRKYRPQTFADVVGQQHVVGTLQRAVLEGRTSHAYLFCGPRGTGKTTMARLLAKALMCEQGAGHLPDGTCEQCQRIAAGEHPDVYELDAASRTGVDSVREEIINNVSYAPTQGSYKVYIIDEVHMLTTAAFNALLKTLEEPPEHVVFVLCTTDPQKVPATILSRVQRFDFRPIGNEDILKHLVYVCEQEGFTYEDAALELVTRNARGGMRDALSTLEQLSVFGGGVIGLDAAQDLLGAVSGGALDQVVQAVAARDVSALFVRVGELVNAGRDLLQFTRELAAHLRDVYVVASVGANPAVLPEGADVAKLQAQAAAFGPADRVARILALLGDVSREMAVAPNQRLVLEIAFVRMARPESDLTLESLAERIAVLEQRLASGGGGGHVAASAPAPTAASAAQAPASAGSTSAAAPAPQSEPQPTPTPAPAPRQSEPVAQPAPAPQQAQTRSASPSQPTQAPAPQSAPRSNASQQVQTRSAVTDPGALQRSWRKVVSELVSRIPARGTLLTNAVATADDGTKLTVSLPKGSTFALKMLERPDVRAIVEGVVNEVFGRRSIEYVEGTSSDLQVPAYAARQSVGGASAQQPVPQQPAPQQPAPQPQPGYPMPWDAPAASPDPQPAPNAGLAEPYYERVPYEDLGTPKTAPDEMPPYEQYAPDPAPFSAPEPEQAPAPFSTPVPEPAPQQPAAPAPFSPPAPAPEPVAQPAPTQEPQPQAAPTSQPEPTPEPKQAPTTSPESDPAPEILTELPPDLSNILATAFEVFGDDVRVSKG